MCPSSSKGGGRSGPAGPPYEWRQASALASALAKPAASAASAERNQTSALVRSYQGLLGAWNFMEVLLPLISKPSGAEPSSSGAAESGPNSLAAALVGRSLGGLGGGSLGGRSLGSSLGGRRLGRSLGGRCLGGRSLGGVGSGASVAASAAASACGRLGRGTGGLGGRGVSAVGVATGGLDGGLLGVAAQQLALPLGQRLLGADVGALGAGLGAGAGDQALGDGVGDHAGQQADGADGVVVARDREVDQVGVAVGVEDADDRDPQLAGLLDGEVLLVGVDDPDGGRRAAHLADAAERLVELVALAAHLQQLLLGAAAAGDVVEVDLVELLEAVDPLVHGLEVGEHAAQPALVDVGHPDAGRLLGDGLLGLLLGADEHHGAALGDGLLDEGVGAVDVGQRLLQVDDVDAVALGHDEALHLRVPATGLVPEVDAALEKLAHGDDCHGVLLLCGARARCARPSSRTDRALSSGCFQLPPPAGAGRPDAHARSDPV